MNVLQPLKKQAMLSLAYEQFHSSLLSLQLFHLKTSFKLNWTGRNTDLFHIICLSPQFHQKHQQESLNVLDRSLFIASHCSLKSLF